MVTERSRLSCFPVSRHSAANRAASRMAVLSAASRNVTFTE